MDRVTSLTELQNCIAVEFSVAPDQLPTDVPLAELGFDSVAFVELLGIMDQI